MWSSTRGPAPHTLEPQEWGAGRQQVMVACPQQHLYGAFQHLLLISCPFFYFEIGSLNWGYSPVGRVLAQPAGSSGSIPVLRKTRQVNHP